MDSAVPVFASGRCTAGMKKMITFCENGMDVVKWSARIEADTADQRIMAF